MRSNRNIILTLTLFLHLIFPQAFSQNIKKIDSLEKQLSKVTEDTGKVMMFVALANEYASSDPVKSLDLSAQAFQLATHLGYKKGIIASHVAKGTVYLNMSEADSVKMYFDMALTLASEIRDSIGIADAYNGLAKNEMLGGHQAESIEKYKVAAGIYQRHKLLSRQASASVYMSMAYADLGEYEQALKSAMEAEELFKKTNDKYGLGKVYLTIGDVY